MVRLLLYLCLINLLTIDTIIILLFFKLKEFMKLGGAINDICTKFN